MSSQLSLKQKMSENFRRKRDNMLRTFIAAAPRKEPVLKIIDLGGSAVYWKRVGHDFLRQQNAFVTLINITESELKAEDAPEDLFAQQVGNACKLDMADNSFDICHSNSVVEHVGGWQEMLGFGREVNRIAPSHYIQTPNFWFPIDPHFASAPAIHWMPRPMSARLMEWFPIATAGRAKDASTAFSFVDSSRLLTTRQMRILFPDSEIHFEKLALLSKSIIAIHTSTDN